MTITISTGQSITYLSIPTYIKGQVLDYHLFHILCPVNNITSFLPAPTVNTSRGSTTLTRDLVHQRLANSCDDIVDKICIDQTMLGLPKSPFPKRTCQCPLYALASLTCPRGKFLDSSLLRRGQLLHIDFAFWDKVSKLGFTSVLSIIDASTRMLCVCCTATKCAPLEILDYFLYILLKENMQIHTVCVDEDGALARSSEFTHFLLTCHLTLDTTGGYNSWFNGMVECSNRNSKQSSCLITKLWL